MADMTELEQMKAKLAALKAAKAKLEAEKAQQNAGDSAPKEEPKVEAKPEVKEEPKAEAKPEVKEEPKAEAKPEVKEEPKAEVKPEVKEEPKAEEKPMAKEEVPSIRPSKPAVKPVVKSGAAAVKPGVKPGAKPAAKPVAKPGVKPVPHKPAAPKAPSLLDDPEYREMLRRKTRKINLIIIGMTCVITLIICGVVLGINFLRGGSVKNPLKNEAQAQAIKIDTEAGIIKQSYGQEGQEEAKQEKPKDPFEIAYEELRGKLDPKATNKGSALEIKEALLNNIKLLDEFLQRWRDEKSEDKLYQNVQKMRDTQKSNYDFYDEE